MIEQEHIPVYKAVLMEAVTLCGANAGSMYTIDLALGGYSLVHQHMWQNEAPFITPMNVKSPVDVHLFESIRNRVRYVMPIESADFSKNRPLNDSLGRQFFRIIAPITYNNNCICFIDLVAIDSEFIRDREKLFGSLKALSEQLVPVYEKDFCVRIFKNLQRPVDFTASSDVFFSDLASIIYEAAGMKFVAVRELTEDGALRCLAHHGFTQGLADENLDLNDFEKIPPYRDAIVEGKTTAIKSIKSIVHPELALLRKRDPLSEIRSFVTVPIKVGTTIFGVMSVATSVEYEYSDLELLGFESIANAVGVSISNFRNFRAAASEIHKFGEVSTIINGVEIAQSVRHEVKNILVDCQTITMLITRNLKNPSLTIENDLKKLSESVKEAGTVLEKIKIATRPPEKTLKAVNIVSLWDQARSLTLGRFSELSVNVYYDGPRDLTVSVYPDWFRQVFLNLLLNSADAFKDRRVKGNRKITLRAERYSEREENITWLYTDNATGIEPSSLYVPVGLEQVPIGNLIFEANVTSKREKDGSGWGLYLVRRIMDDHKGSIDLVDYRGGVTFRISLPRRLS